MTKQEYMEQLTEKLSVFDEALAKEILDDYEGHFREGNDNGKTEEEICKELGSIDEIIEELGQLYEPKKKEENNFQSTVNDVVNDALNLANNFADTLVKGIKSGIDYGKRTWYEKSKEDVVDAECTKEKISNCRNVVMDAGCAKVTVDKAEDEEFHVEYINRGSLKDRILYHFHGEQRGDSFYGRLVREQGNSSLFQMLKYPEIEIIMKIPQDFDAVEILTTSGDIRLNNITAKEVHLSTSSGDITTEEYEAVKNVMESTSGDVVIRNATGNTLKLKLKSGDVSVNGCMFEEMACKNKSGELSGEDNSLMKLSAEMSSGAVKLEKLISDSFSVSVKSGDICLADSTIKELSAAAESGSINIDGMESEKVDASSESGSIKIRSKSPQYTLKTSSGDIKLQSENEMNGKLQSASGNVDVEIISGEDGYTAEVDAVSGNVCLQFKNGSKHGMHKGRYTMGDGKSMLVVSSVSGDIHIHA